MKLLQIPFLDNTGVLPDSVPSVNEEISQLRALPMDELIQKAVNGIVTLAINLVLAIVVFYLGRFIINKLYRMVSNLLIKRNIDTSLAVFILSLIRMVLYFILIVTVIGILGIETSSFIAIFASAGVAIGMALSGTLQNFAGGVLILLLKPYKIGDYIEAQGFAGTVREIQIFHTIITTADNKTIILPNGGLSTGSINNWSKGDYRRVDWIVGISYGQAVGPAREVILDILTKDPDVLQTTIAEDKERRRIEILESIDENGDGIPDYLQQDELDAQAGKLTRSLRRKKRKAQEVLDKASAKAPSPVTVEFDSKERKPDVVVAALADSSVNLKATAWVRSANYWPVFYRVNEAIYNRFNEIGIEFPFPQLDVHLDRPEA